MGEFDLSLDAMELKSLRLLGSPLTCASEALSDPRVRCGLSHMPTPIIGHRSAHSPGPPPDHFCIPSAAYAWQTAV